MATLPSFIEAPVENLRFCRSGYDFGVISSNGVFTHLKLTRDHKPFPQVSEEVSDVIFYYHGPLFFQRRDRSLSLWPPGLKGRGKDWTRLPSETRKGIKTMDASADWAAVLTLEDELLVWDKNGNSDRPLRRVRGLVDLAVVGERVYALGKDGKVTIAVSPDSREVEEVVFEDVAWIKSEGTSLLGRLRDGGLFTDAETEERLPGIQGVLPLAGTPTPEAVSLGELGLFWIEPVKPGP